MRIYNRLAALAALLGIAAPALAAPPDIREGLWEITTKVDMPGMPANMPPQSMQQCITRKDLEDPRKMTQGPADKQTQCATTDYRVQGNTATWKMACKGENAMTGAGSITYSGTSYTGTSKMAMTRGGQTMNMTMNYSGRYIGPCKK